ncbi:MAG: tRNA pseudouridine(13) synthase TruD [Planctomycetes bacterium]|nr:tRNA pseudouridine(13) synthase TruD [Planctomycetota bacterium]MCW8136530.1 tRNA pseudouridine(13) synthase TruD [Planctomycetota bacterium]
MKLKTRPEDFVVTENAEFTPDPAGAHFVYELQKRSLATLEALAILARRNKLRPKELSAAGLKDKHGLTRQLFSASRPLKTDTGDERLQLRFVGKARAPLTAEVIRGNAFDITMRDLGPEALAVLARNTAEIAAAGVPNYYDNQRFGGIAHGQGFIAKALAQGNYEEAMRLHLAAPHRKQSMRDKQNRRLAMQHWGDWRTLEQAMTRSPERALVAYLAEHPGDWAGCFERITPALRTLFVSAYQSFLFNRVLTRMVSEAGPHEVLHNRSGELAFHRQPLPQPWRDLELPLPGASTKPEQFPLAAPHLQAVLHEEGVTLEQLKLGGLARTRFKAAARKALVFPAGLVVQPPEPDDLNEGRHKVRLAFELPRGSFATIITRRLVLRESAG